MKYGKYKNVPIFILEDVTKIELKKGEIKNNEIIIQSLRTGDTGVVNKEQIKDITTNYYKIMKGDKKWKLK